MTGSLDKHILNHEQVATNFMSAIKKVGLDRVDAVISASESNSCTLIGQLKLDMDKSMSISIRVWNEKGSVAIANTSDSSISGIAAAAKTAYDLAGLSENSEVLTYQPITGPEARHGGLNDSLSEITLIAKELEENKNKLAEGVSPSYVGASHAHFGKMYIDGAGRYHLSMSSRSSVYVQAMVQTDKKPRTAKKHLVTKDYIPENFGHCFKEASNKALFHKHYKNVETSLYPVVFSGRAFLDLIYAFSGLFSGQHLLDNRSLLTKESLGEAVASSILTIADRPFDPRNISPVYFNGEGSLTKAVPIIDKGRLTSFLNSRHSAKKLGLPATGHASFSSKPSTSPYFLCVESSNEIVGDFDEKNYVYVDEVNSLHAGINHGLGTFSLPFEGWIVQDGAKTSIGAAVVAGDFRELLKNIVRLGPTAHLEISGVCPDIYVKSLKITGDS
jgi:PmbA protein